MHCSLIIRHAIADCTPMSVSPLKSPLAKVTDAGESLKPVSAGLTWRAVVIGCFLTVLLTIWTLHSEFITRSSFITVTHHPVAALCPFVVMVLIVNPLLKSLSICRGFTRQELIVIFFLVFTASAIPGWAFSNYAVSIISGPFYFVTPENRWADLFLDYLPTWLVLRDEGGALKAFYEGVPDGQVIPWQVWTIPMIWWGTLYFAIFLVGASMMVILRKQWVEHERLAFPLAQVPLMLVEGVEDNSYLPRIARKPLFWWGFGLTIGILIWNMFSYFGAVPAIPIGAGYSSPLTLYESFPPILVRINYLLVGVAYFTRVEVLLSVWFLYLIRIIQQGVMTRVGVPEVLEVMHFQHLSGFFVFVIFSIWIARKHLITVAGKALGKRPDVDDSKEFFSYRTAVFSFVFGVLYMVFWLWSTGMSLWIIIVMLTVLLLLYLGVTRIVAETGLVSLDLPYNSANEITMRFVGTEYITPRTLTGLWLCQTFTRNWRTLGMCSMAHAAKVGDVMGGVGKGVFAAIAGALTLGFTTAIVYTLYLGYDMGASQLVAGGFESGAKGYWGQLETFMTNPQSLTPTQFTFVCVGILGSLVLVWGYHHVPLWPLHPVGFGIVTTYAADHAFFSIFMVWLVKSILLRLGGVSLYRTAQPFFIGILAGYAIGVFLSFVVDAIWFPGAGHVVDSW